MGTVGDDEAELGEAVGGDEFGEDVEEGGCYFCGV